MAASDPYHHSQIPARGPAVIMSAEALALRLEEEISRSERSGMGLSCLIVVIGNLDELSYAHGSALAEDALLFIADVLARELRPFDRIGRLSEEELLLVLPHTDGPRGEIVARRMLGRLRSVKVESEGTRRPLRILVGLATWTRDTGIEDLLAQARAAVQRDHFAPSLRPGGPPPALGRD